MNFFRKSRPENLAGWLEIATRKLAPAAKERIRSDIESHYDEAVARHLENGLSGFAAQTAGAGDAKHDLVTILRFRAAHLAALSELGDPKAAARRFRREHLTGPEFQMVANLLRESRRFGWMQFEFVAALGICFVLSQIHGLPVPYMVVLVVPCALFAVLEIVAFLLPRGKNLGLRWLILRESARNLGLGVVFLNVMLTGPRSHVWDTIPMAHNKFDFIWIVMRVGSWFVSCFFMIGFVMMPLLFLWQCLVYFRMRNKLGKVAEDWKIETGETRNAVPPGNPIAS